MGRKLVLKMSQSIDGFVGKLNGEVDWIFKSFDEGVSADMLDVVRQAGLHIMGSVTYKDMADYWPDSNEVFAAPMNEIPKIVFSDSLKEAKWGETSILSGDIVKHINKLKQEDGKYILAHGGARFAQSLIKHDLIDEYRLFVHPAVVGKGLSIFSEINQLRHLKAASVTSFPSGTIAYTLYKYE
jgi:dihydrofolate reductase